MNKNTPINYTFKLHPEFIIAPDNEKHSFVSSSQLAKLYGLNWHECAIQYSPSSTEGWIGDTLHLHPRYKGDYKEYLNKMIHEYLNKMIHENENE